MQCSQKLPPQKPFSELTRGETYLQKDAERNITDPGEQIPHSKTKGELIEDRAAGQDCSWPARPGRKLKKGWNHVSGRCWRGMTSAKETLRLNT